MKAKSLGKYTAQCHFDTAVLSRESNRPQLSRESCIRFMDSSGISKQLVREARVVSMIYSAFTKKRKSRLLSGNILIKSAKSYLQNTEGVVLLKHQEHVCWQHSTQSKEP